MPEDLTREELYKLVWKKSVFQIAQEYGWSDRGIGKLCEKYKIPTPPRGYWAKYYAGSKTKPPRLPSLRSHNPYHIILSAKIKDKEDISQSIKEIVEQELLQENLVTVPEKISRYHPLIKERVKGNLDEVCARRNRTLSVLLFALETRGFEIEDIGYPFTFKLKHEAEKLHLELDEKIIKHKRPLTPEEEKKKIYPTQKWEYDLERTNRLKLSLYSYIGRYGPDRIKSYTDKKDLIIENILNEVIAQILRYVYKKKEERIERDLERQRIQEERERRERELENREKLLNEISSWKKANDIRGFVKAANETGEVEKDWVDWALNYANIVDPLSHVSDDVPKSWF